MATATGNTRKELRRFRVPQFLRRLLCSCLYLCPYPYPYLGNEPADDGAAALLRRNGPPLRDTALWEAHVRRARSL